MGDVWVNLAREAGENARTALRTLPDGEDKDQKIKTLKIKNLKVLIEAHESGGAPERRSESSLPEQEAAPPPKRMKPAPGPVLNAVDLEGRRFEMSEVVVNFANVGASFGMKVLHRDAALNRGRFDWDGVRRALLFLKSERGWQITGVINENFTATDQRSGHTRQVEMPEDIRALCEDVIETPRIMGANHSSADDEMTIKCAYRRNCLFLDNDNYRDWTQQLRDQKIRDWFVNFQALLQCRYYFDKGTGTFDLIEGNYPAWMLAKGKDALVDKSALWSMRRDQ